MDVIEPVKRLAEKATGIGIPSREEALACVRDCRPSRMKFRDDGYIPNNPKFPLLYFRKAMRFLSVCRDSIRFMAANTRSGNSPSRPAHPHMPRMRAFTSIGVRVDRAAVAAV